MKRLIAFFIALSLVSPVMAPERAHAATDIKNDASLGANLRAAWFLSNVAITADATGNGNTLTNTNSATLGVGLNGENAVDFESTNSQYMSIADNAFISFTTSFSASFWWKPETVTNGDMFLRKYGAAGARDYIYEQAVTAGNMSPRLEYFDNAYRDGLTSATTAVSAGNWYHIVITFSSGSIIYYINGSKLGNTITPNNLAMADGNGTLYISSSNGAGQYIDGLVHQMLLYNKVLTATDVTNLYNSGAGLPWEATATPGEEYRIIFSLVPIDLPHHLAWK